MMKIIKADYLYVEGEFKKEYGVAFKQSIIAVAPLVTLLERYPDAELLATEPNSVLYPGFINTHVHLEFSANKTTLDYGSFLPWLYSVIEERERLIEQCDTQMMRDSCDAMLRSGVTTFGAISSMGLDLDACANTPQRVVFFNELIGSSPQSVDALYGDFLQRLEASSQYKNRRITPAIAIHAPYSVHPILLKKAISLAKEKNTLISAHFLESPAERTWLEKSEGEFKEFFQNFFNQSVANNSIDGFISAFDTYPTHFTHCVQANDAELEKLSREGHSIAHCPRSNRLLGCGRLEIEKLQKLDILYSVATDGLSSNNTLNIFDELRAALMIHQGVELKDLASELINSVTSSAAEILKLECGRITEGYQADFAIVTLPETPNREDDIALWTILHTKKVSQLYIQGEQYV